VVGAKRDGWYCSSIKQGVRRGMDGNGFSFLFLGQLRSCGFFVRYPGGRCFLFILESVLAC